MINYIYLLVLFMINANTAFMNKCASLTSRETFYNGKYVLM